MESNVGVSGHVCLKPICCMYVLGLYRQATGSRLHISYYTLLGYSQKLYEISKPVEQLKCSYFNYHRELPSANQVR